jgi:hypothetical protein
MKEKENGSFSAPISRNNKPDQQARSAGQISRPDHSA